MGLSLAEMITVALVSELRGYDGRLSEASALVPKQYLLFGCHDDKNLPS